MLKGSRSGPAASLVTEESNDELTQFTNGTRGVTASDIKNALSPLAVSNIESSVSLIHSPAATEGFETNLLSEIHLPTHVPRSGKTAKNYVQRFTDVPVCPTCHRPYMLAQLYFTLLQTVIESSRRSYYKHFFKQLGCIGSGSFGTVYRVRHQLSTVELGVYALKIISVGNSRPWLLKALSEVTVLEKLRHQNVVQYHHCWVEKYKTALNTLEETLHLFILLNYCKGGSLLNLRRSILNRQMTEEEVLFLLFQAASGLAHLHAIGFLSRDVKLGNILLDGELPDDEPKQFISCICNDPADYPDKLTSRQKQELRYKQHQFNSDESLREHCRQLHYIRKVGINGLRVRITDFGQVGDGASAGTELYLAPELQCMTSPFVDTLTGASRGDEEEEGRDGVKARDANLIIKEKSLQDFTASRPRSTHSTDVYSLGISFLVLLFDYSELAAKNASLPHPLTETAFNNHINSMEHQKDLIESIKDLRAIYSKGLCDLLTMMCHPNPSVRPSASEVASFCFTQRFQVLNVGTTASFSSASPSGPSRTIVTNAIQLYSQCRRPFSADISDSTSQSKLVAQPEKGPAPASAAASQPAPGLKQTVSPGSVSEADTGIPCRCPEGELDNVFYTVIRAPSFSRHQPAKRARRRKMHKRLSTQVLIFVLAITNGMGIIMSFCLLGLLRRAKL